MTREELCWLAGWLEGEGTFYYSMSKGNSPRIVIQVFSTDVDVLQKAHRLMGSKGLTKIPPKKLRGDRWTSNGGHRTEVQGEVAAALMRKLLPFMGKRRSEQIKAALDAWEVRPSKPMLKPCACGCGRMVYGGRRILYAQRPGACATRAYRARQKALAV